LGTISPAIICAAEMEDEGDRRRDDHGDPVTEDSAQRAF